MDLAGWVQGYAQAWVTGDVDLLVSLFTEDATYRSSPFRQPFRGHDEIREYGRRCAAAQEGKRVETGAPFVDGQRVAVEWWTTMIEDGKEVTLPGCLLLRFGPDRRCSDLREYWHIESGAREPFAGWGT